MLIKIRYPNYVSVLISGVFFAHELLMSLGDILTVYIYVYDILTIPILITVPIPIVSDEEAMPRNVNVFSFFNKFLQRGYINVCFSVLAPES